MNRQILISRSSKLYNRVQEFAERYLTFLHTRPRVYITYDLGRLAKENNYLLCYFVYLWILSKLMNIGNLPID